MQPELNKAFSPWALGPLSLRNRFIKAATNEGMAPGGVPSKALLRHHQAMAVGGVGMTTVAYCAVAPDGRTFADQISLDASTRPHLRAVTNAVHRAGAAACAQLTHGGAFNFLAQLPGNSPVSSSGGFNPPGLMSGRLFKHEASREELEELKQSFVRGALEAETSGFDAVEIHMGHGYLLSQFMSPGYNRRKDEYGGSAEARAKFPADVLSAVLDAVGNRLAVICKISSFEGFRGGGDIGDAEVSARCLFRAGAHLIVPSAGMNVESPWQIFGSPMPRGIGGANASWMMRAANVALRLSQPAITFKELYLLEAARRLRVTIDGPLAYIGGITSADGIAAAIREGFDALVIGRALIHQSDFLLALRSGEITQSGCTHCNLCVAAMYTPSGTRCPLTSPEQIDLNKMPAALG